ncbi:MAG TPA: type III pantothenate kinase, partial [Thermoanaerobaculia bacterium]
MSAKVAGETLLAVDVGNSNTVLGLWRGAELQRHWRLTTRREATSDEIALSVRGLLAAGPAGAETTDPTRVIVASVVPSLKFSLRQALRQLFGREPLFIEPGVKTGMPILYEVPQEVGADRIVNAVAAFDAVGGPCIVVDFGTATTFDVVTARGEYGGGVIVPGIAISAEALFEKAARLWRVEIRRPDRVVGKTTAG